MSGGAVHRDLHCLHKKMFGFSRMKLLVILGQLRKMMSTVALRWACLCLVQCNLPFATCYSPYLVVFTGEGIGYSPYQVVGGCCTPHWTGGSPCKAAAQACPSKRQLRHPSPSARGWPQAPLLCHHDPLFAPPTHGYLGPTQHHPGSSSPPHQSLRSFAESYFR